MAKSKKPKDENGQTRQEQTSELSSDVLAAINKTFKNSATILSDANLVTDWFTTGCRGLDLAISNRKNGGVPAGIILEIFGPSSSSKSLLAVQMMAECQKRGGLAVLFDTEKAVGMLDFFHAVGLDSSKLVYSDDLRCLEDIYEAVETIITRTVEANTDKPVIIVIDSVMGATTHLELESDYQKDGWATAKALINSKAMRKLPTLIKGRNILLLLINQVRDNMSGGIGSDPYVTSGGKAIGFTAGVRLQTKIASRSSKNLDGETVEVKVVKNRFGPPRRKVQFTVNYNSGIDDYSSLFNMLKELELIKPAGNQGHSFEYVDVDTGELKVVKFREVNFAEYCGENPTIEELLYDAVCDAYILRYKSGNEPITEDSEDLILEN